MKEEPTVCVVIPAYNAASYIGAAVSSALHQTYPHVSIVVVDDGSTDDTAAIAEAYGDKVQVLRQANAGPSTARNAGIAASESDLICLCDSDDILMPNHVEEAIRAIRDGGDRTWATSASWLLTDTGIEARKREFHFGTPARDQQVDAILDANFVPILSTFPRSMIDEVGPMDERMRWCEDWDLWLRAILRGWRVNFVTQRTALYRLSSGSLSSKDDGMVTGHKMLLQKTLDDSAGLLSPDQQDRLRLRLKSPSYIELNRAANRAVQQADLGTAKSLYRQSRALNALDGNARFRARALRWYPASTNVAGRAVARIAAAVMRRRRTR